METCTHSPDEVADRYGVSNDYVMRQVRRHGWPHLKVGRSVMFTDAHVAALDAMYDVPVGPPVAVDLAWGRKTRRSG